MRANSRIVNLPTTMHVRKWAALLSAQGLLHDLDHVIGCRPATGKLRSPLCEPKSARSQRPYWASNTSRTRSLSELVRLKKAPPAGLEPAPPASGGRSGLSSSSFRSVVGVLSRPSRTRGARGSLQSSPIDCQFGLPRFRGRARRTRLTVRDCWLPLYGCGAVAVVGAGGTLDPSGL